jgi:hypothetical protein
MEYLFEARETGCALTGSYKGRLRQSHNSTFDVCGNEIRQIGKDHAYNCGGNTKGK